jgi:nicotinamidase-related amidase
VKLGYETVVPTAATTAIDVEAGDGARAEAELAAAGVELAA